MFPGDGTGEQTVPPCLELLALACEACGGVTLDCTVSPADSPAASPADWPTDCPIAARDSDAILLGSAGGAPRWRAALDLYASVRPVRGLPGVAGPLADPRAAALDILLVHGCGSTQDGHERLVGTAARLTLSRARDRARAVDPANATRRGGPRSDVAMSEDAYMAAPPRLTRIDEFDEFDEFDGVDGVDRSDRVGTDHTSGESGSARFRRRFRQVTGEFELRTDASRIDTLAMNLVLRPWEYDVLVGEHRSGSTLAALGTALAGGPDYAPAADIGDRHALFRPGHGGAAEPARRVGIGRANPTALFLSAAMMLEWLGERHGCQPAREAGERLRRAIEDAFRDGELAIRERGGKAGTAETTAAVRAALIDGRAAAGGHRSIA